MTDWEFVFDGVVGFLTSPIWNVPILTFFEKNCIVFNPKDENEIAYTEIHKEYSALVEDLLSSYLKDVGISEEQFVRACETGSNDNSKTADQSIFEQVWAAEDFKLFKSLMIKKNLDLELQALRMIQQRNGVVPEMFASEIEQNPEKKSRSKHQEDEDKLLRQVMEQSKQEYEKEKGKKKEIERMEKSLALSKEESERLHELAERELNELERMVNLSLKLEKRCSQEKEKTGDSKKDTKESFESKSKSSRPASTGKPAESKSVARDSAKIAQVADSTLSKQAAVKQPSADKQETRPAAPNRQRESRHKEKSSSAGSGQLKSSSKQPAAPSGPLLQASTPAMAAADWILSAKAEASKAPHKSTTETQTAKNSEQSLMDEEIMKRANYMRAQRDKLLNLKRQERAKQLEVFADEQPVKRPMSSRLARQQALGPGAEKTARSDVNEPEKRAASNEVDASRRKLMRALGEGLKEAVKRAHTENDSK